MKYRRSIVVLLAALLLAAGPAHAETAEPQPIVQVNQGKPGTVTALKSEHRAVRQQLGKIASGIETALEKNDVKLAERLYKLEVHTMNLLVRTADAKYRSGKSRETALADVRTTLRQVLRMQERVLHHTLNELDKALPGEPHRELWAKNGVDLYRPLGRAETPKPGQAAPTRGDAIRDMRNASQDEMSEIHYMGKKNIEKIRSGQLFEWVQVGKRVRWTAAGAKHPVIALEGREKKAKNPKPVSVRGAGSSMILRDSKGEIISAVVSDSSGNYKPGIGSTIGMVQKLEDAGVDNRAITITRVLPGEPVLVKLLLKSKKKLKKKQIKEHVGKLSARVRKQLSGETLKKRLAEASTRKSKSGARNSGRAGIGRRLAKKNNRKNSKKPRRAVRTARR